ncbi:jg245 [Pararge aegeria aegeria]|uniref:Jg245 protein n=1 Tax=Pararge aegeria aegeria TaxID=348720 RepID=A0A8S4QQC9_9NEOP|nr:jg245 [Pararge aegeria aegeria]
MKEYRFEPPHAIVPVEDGQEHKLMFKYVLSANFFANPRCLHACVRACVRTCMVQDDRRYEMPRNIFFHNSLNVGIE